MIRGKYQKKKKKKNHTWGNMRIVESKWQKRKTQSNAIKQQNNVEQPQ